ELIITDTMHQRKAKMFEISDGFIALPGGFGTFEEMLEMLTWSQIGYSSKPCGILNVNGYYDELLKFFDKAVEMRFVKQEHRNAIIVDTDPKSILDQFDKFKPVTIDKWIDKD
ncbi:MAG: TIGR00730 family Rossman fold protein, partial [Candidatus Cloacimonetes bacterium]|nr:TIGR00730 family Rossman fold protein [Candidatus Cloacimonadota bacterium]